MIKGLTSPDKKVYDKTVQKYKENIKKFKEPKPLRERMAETKKRNKKKNIYCRLSIIHILQGQFKRKWHKTKAIFYTSRS